MPAVVIVGAQWGDEGKGKVTDFLAERAHIVARYQGGDNAGHTVVIEGKEYKLFLVPAGVFRPDTLAILGNGMAIDPKVLVEEIENLRAHGHRADNIRISHAAHLVMPYHRALDEADEERLGGERIGTTRRGIGPAYLDKYARVGLRMADLLDKEAFTQKVERNVRYKNLILKKVYNKPGFDGAAMAREYLEVADKLCPYITDVSILINEALNEGKNVLFEGAQGSMLEIDQGTYPFVTSSYPTAGGACTGTGVGPTRINQVIGVVKAFTSRVGNGPFPTEIDDEIGAYIRERGHEYGTRTGRPRRVGWLDAVALRTAVRVNALDSLAITRLDTLAGVPVVKMAVGYRLGSQTIRDIPISQRQLGMCEPVYEQFEGWTEEELDQATSYDSVPDKVKRYINAIERLCGVEAKVLGVGQDRTHTIIKGDLVF